MKKLYTLFSLLVLTLVLSGCDLIGGDEVISIHLLQGQDTIELGSDWEDAGARLYVANVEYIAITTDTVDTDTLGLYEVTYSYEYSGEEYTITRYVMVVDQTPPEVTLEAGVDTIHVGEEWVNAGISYSDNGLIDTVLEDGTVDNTTAGTYEITYTVTDESGNSTTVTRYVDVIE